MGISDKTRKLLWGRSGSRCAICKQELIMNSTSVDDESIVGEECHIVSRKSNGQRCHLNFSDVELDSYNNLILLCRVHHKMIDDQDNTYSVENLHQLKTKHEMWVHERLNTNSFENKKIFLRRDKENIPKYLWRLTTGREILNIVAGADASSFDNDELLAQDEIELVGGFLEVVRDWGDLNEDLSPADRVRISFDLSQALNELEQAGFYVFGGREKQMLEGNEQVLDWTVAILRVLRSTNKSIIIVPSDKTVT